MSGIDPDRRRLAQSLLIEKRERRRKLAQLSIEEKIRRLIEIQRLANDVRRKTGRKPLPEWKTNP